MVSLIRKTPDVISLELTRDEIRIIGNSINETIEQLPDWEFPIRVGATKGEADALLEALHSVLAEDS